MEKSEIPDFLLRVLNTKLENKDKIAIIESIGYLECVMDFLDKFENQGLKTNKWF